MEEALRQTIEHADLADGQAILELGCGWGSLALSMARRFPNAEITAVSNSQSQREHRRFAVCIGQPELRLRNQCSRTHVPKQEFGLIHDPVRA